MKKFTQWVDVIREAEERQQSELQKSYKDYFSAKLNKFGAKSPADLDAEQKAEFFNEIKKDWEKGTGAKPAGKKDVEEHGVKESVNEASQEEQIKKEVISKLSDFFGCAPGNLSKFKFDGNDNIKELTKALRSTSDEGTAQYYRIAIIMAKRDLGIHESEDLNESAIEIASGIILGLVGLKTIGLLAKGIFGTLKLKMMKDPEKLKELADLIYDRAITKDSKGLLQGALWVNAVKRMIDKGEIKDGFQLCKTSLAMDKIDINKIFEAEGFDLSEDVNEGKKQITIEFTKSNQHEVSTYVFRHLEDDKLVDTGNNGPDYMDLKFDAKNYDKVIDALRRCDAIDHIRESEEFEINEAVATPEELASFIQKEEKHFAAFLKPKKLTATVNGKVVTIKPGSGSFTITVDYAKSTINTTGKPEWPESTSYVELMEYIKITKFKLNESTYINEGKKEDLTKQLEVIFAQIKSMNLEKSAELAFTKTGLAFGFLDMLSKPGAIKNLQDKSPEAKQRIKDAHSALTGANSSDEIKSILVGLIDSVNESAIFEADIKNAADFKEYATTVLKKQHGDKFDEKVADKVIKGLSDEAEKSGDWGAAVGKLNA